MPPRLKRAAAAISLCLGACAAPRVAVPPPAVAVVAQAPIVLQDSPKTVVADTVLTEKTEAEKAPPPLEIVEAKAQEPEALALCESQDEGNGRCLWAEPMNPKPGDMVMFETDASSWIGAATLSAFGRDVKMYRHGDRWRGFVAVPLNAEPAAFQTRLTLTSAEDNVSYRCLDALVSGRDFGTGGQLKVSRRFTKKAAVAAAKLTPDDGTATWVEPKDVAPYSTQLFLWPRAGQMTSGFGLSRSYNKKFTTRHMGIDIEGQIGDRVFATQDGVVRYSGKLRSTGNTLVLDHGGGVLSIYMHLSQRLKKVGERASQGELIGAVGRTGRVTGPHLHFAMSVQGRFVDPLQVLSHPLVTTAPGLPCREEPSSHSVR